MNFFNPKRLAIAALIPAAWVTLLCSPQTTQAQAPAGKLENLGPNVNSQYRDSYPILTGDGKTLFLSRSNDPGNYGNDKAKYDIWFSTLQPDGKWSPAKNIGYPLNNEGDNVVLGTTSDGNKLLLINRYNSNGTPKGSGLSISEKTANGWSLPMDVNVNYTNTGTGSYFLSGDGRTLLLAIQQGPEKGNIGASDLYVSFQDKYGAWSDPINLGATINTEAEEMTPFLAADGTSLYFSSKGHKGFGDADIFMARRLDDSWTKWTKPINLGNGVNTAGFDGYFKISADGKYALLVSSQNAIGDRDIFRLNLPGPISQALLPNAAVLITGKVLNAKTNQPIEATIRYEKLPQGSDAGFAKTDPNTGEYKIVVPSGARYGFYASADNYISQNENIDLSKQKFYEEIKRDLKLVPIEAGAELRINNIFFTTGSAALQPESYPELNRLFDVLKQNASMSIEISGHTDNVGADELNQKLSEQRAAAVSAYLVGKDPALKSRITTKGYGKTQPVASNDNEEGRRQNRRVVVKIVNK